MMTPREPFKFLDAYTKEDADIFFGREAEIEELYTRVFYSDLLLVYGHSGTGKTSLIQCGLANRFEDSDWLPISIRYGEGILQSLNREIEKFAITPVRSQETALRSAASLTTNEETALRSAASLTTNGETALRSAASLTTNDLEKKLHSLYLDYFKPIYLIFDQFEELFIFGTDDEREDLAQEIAALMEASFEIKVIFIIREEYLAELTALESHLPDLFTNRFRIERMGPTGAVSAIESPCKVCGIGIEEGVADRILERLGTEKVGRVELTYLQVLLDKLYKNAIETNPEAPILTSQELEALGTIGDILGEFLDEQLAAMSEAEASLGEAVLKTLITPDGTKKIMDVHDIVAALTSMGTPAEADKVTTILNHFVSVRILSEKEESGRYELRHDSLAQKIFERMTALEKDLLDVIQTIENRYKEYQARGTLLDNVALDYVAPYQSRLSFKPQIAEFISTSRGEITKARRKKFTILFAALIAILLVVSGLGIVSYVSYLESEKQRKIATSRQQEAEEQRKIAEQQQEIAEQQQEIAEEQRQIAEQQTEIAKEHLKQSEMSAIEALNQTSKALFLSHDELGALIAGVKAAKQAKQADIPTILQQQALFNLRGLISTVQEKNRLDGHESGISCIDFSPDGKLIASGSSDKTIKLWNAADGRELLTLYGHTDPVTSITFSPDGTLLASGGGTLFKSGEVKLWNIKDGREIMTLHKQKHSVTSVAFSPDGTLLASGSDGAITLWNIPDGQEITTLEGHSAIESITFSPDGTLLTSGNNDGSIKLWKVADGQGITSFDVHSGAVSCITFSPDGTLLASGSGKYTEYGEIKLWDATGHEITTIQAHSDVVESITFSPDGMLLASGSHDKTIKLWEVNRKLYPERPSPKEKELDETGAVDAVDIFTGLSPPPPSPPFTGTPIGLPA